MAKKAGVSGATVSRVFNNPDTVSELTREKVFQAAKELNYHPNVIASNLIKGVSGNIGVIVPRIPNVRIFSVYYFTELLNGIGDALSENGYNLILFYHNLKSEPANIVPTAISSTNEFTMDEFSLASRSSSKHIVTGGDYSGYFLGSKVDGCILLGTYLNDPSILELKKKGYRFCLINNYIKNSGISFVDVDNYTGSFDAVKYLIDLGHRSIAFLNGPTLYVNSLDRFEGYRKALEANNIPFDERLVFQGNYGRKSGYYAAKKILSLKKVPSSIFAANDRMAAGLIQGLSEEGIRVPEDISILGYDDSDIATLITPQLTTMHVPFYELGKKCAFEFIKSISNSRGNSEESFQIIIKPELVIRKSTDYKKKVSTESI